jgi:hypothetical protein
MSVYCRVGIAPSPAPKKLWKLLFLVVALFQLDWTVLWRMLGKNPRIALTLLD